MFNSLDAIISYISSIQLSEKDSVKSRFCITKQAFRLLNIAVDPQNVILVAGTNGKGSTSASLCKLLVSSGKNVGLYTSPHLVDIKERIKFNFVDIPENNFISVFNFVHKKCYLENKITLSHFEYLTLIACYYFFIEKKVDYAIFEVGMGGTYDATNVIPHNTCLITSIAIDHERFLGTNIRSIFSNKIGIINNQRNQTVIYTNKLTSDCEEILQSLNCKKLVRAHNYKTQVSYGSETPKFSITINGTEFPLSLQGERACENSSIALTAFEQLGFDVNEYKHALSDLIWVGRMSGVVIGNRKIFLSGDHNPAGIESLCELLSHYQYDKIHIIAGFSIDKNSRDMLEKLHAIRNSVIYLTESSFKPRRIEEYGEEYLSKVNYCRDSIATIQKAIERANTDDMILVTGSLYLVGDILNILKN